MDTSMNTFMMMDENQDMYVAIQDVTTGIWEVSHPGGDFRFHGNRRETEALVRRVMTERVAAEKQLQEGGE